MIVITTDLFTHDLNFSYHLNLILRNQFKVKIRKINYDFLEVSVKNHKNLIKKNTRCGEI